MKSFQIIKAFVVLFSLSIVSFLFVGCQSTEVVEKNIIIYEKIPKPKTIYVYDFVANRADIPVDSTFSSMNIPQSPPQTAEEIKLGNELGDAIAKQLVKKLNALGLNSKKADASTEPEIDDIVIRGYIISADEGDSMERVFIGFGFGKSELMTALEGYQMTEDGLKKLAARKIESLGGQMPGAGLGVASLIIFGNPIGLIVGLGVKSYGEISGSNTIDGLADSTASKIVDVLDEDFKRQGWVTD